MIERISIQPNKLRYKYHSDNSSHFRFVSIAVLYFFGSFFVFATPPSYLTLERSQVVEYQPIAPLVRIWMVYVGQGDGILIQIPNGLADNGGAGYYDILIDTGKTKNIHSFLKHLYSKEISENGTTSIEEIVISHHDQDHVQALSRLSKDPELILGNVYHNGLASYVPEKVGLSNTPRREVVAKWDKNGVMTRAMGTLITNKENRRVLNESYVINTLGDLTKAYKQKKLQGVYKHFAKAVIEAKPTPAKSFKRVTNDPDFISLSHNNVSVQSLWPVENKLFEYYKSERRDNWSDTINGHSITFRFDYGAFSMLFTGDQNEKSLKDFMPHLESRGELDLINTDVIKVPHHGSRHVSKTLFTKMNSEGVQQPRFAFALASMGYKGFYDWRHPSDEVRQWMKYVYRFYGTYTEEKGFSHRDREFLENKDNYVEQSHIVIETDGARFRIFEIPANFPDAIHDLPSVFEVRKGNGTQWIVAEE